MVMTQPAIPTAKSGPGQHALAYAALGWRVLPIKPGEKRPPMTAWQKAASVDTATVRSWFKDLYRGHGVGIATGKDSGLWVLDVDVGPDKDGAESLAQLEIEHGPLPATVEAVTGSGGRHLYFRWPEGRRVITRRDTGHTASPLPAGIDVRGEGGQVLAPPTVHPTGTVYHWREDHSPWEQGLVEAPAWLLEIVCEAPKAEKPAPTLPTQAANGDDSIAEWFNGQTTWDQMLSSRAWTVATEFNGQQYWVRPGKDKAEGHSAVLHLPDGPFVIFSTDGSLARFAQPWARTASGDGWAFSRFGFLAADKHGGDRSEAARQLRIQRDGPGTFNVEPTVEESESTDDGLPTSVNWFALMAREVEAEDWLVDDFWPARRAISIVAKYKSGKSLLLFYVAACLAQGIDPWTGRSREPITVGYWDMEMTEDDVQERAVQFGLEPQNLDRFKYYLLPSIPPLDTEKGGEIVLATLLRDGVQATVFDTIGRVVEGEENTSDTINAYYRFTAQGLKRNAISSARLDHVGHTNQERARGSSSKGADVDVAWILRREGNATKLDNYGVTRCRWVPRTLDLMLNEGPPDVFRPALLGDVPEGTRAVMDILDRLGVPIDHGRDKAARALRDAGEKATNDVLSAAIKHRKQEAGAGWIRPKTCPGQVASRNGENLSGTGSEETASEQASDRLPDRSGQVPESLSDCVRTEGTDRSADHLPDNPSEAEMELWK